MTRRCTLAWAAGALAGSALIAPAGPAHAQLGLPLGGLVTGVTGTVGGVVTDTTSTVTGVVDQVLGGAGGGLLGGGTLDSLLGTLGVAPAASGGAGGTGGAGGSAGPAGTVVGGSGSGGSFIDARSPNVRFTVLSRLSRIAKTGRIPLRVTIDEAGIVAFRGSVRPGRALKKKARARKAAAARPIKFPTAVLAYRKAGSLRVTIQLSRSAQRRLGRVRDARMSLNFVAADVLRNQGKANVKRTVRR